ncbi:hypothetical protein [Streptomyces canus]|uniref:hypothetical protein n=1 Tax=Streptomyces canus TaxID=58343 RepID=UPI00386FB270|nr:hypothetical protein OH824_17995 [Streptomyces canus]
MPPPTSRELAELAYDVYGKSTGGRNYQGLPMPDWDELTTAIQLAWIEAAGAIALNTIASLTGVSGTLEPSVGDVVLVPTDPADNNGATEAPAIITRVWSKTTINVRVLADSEATTWRTSLVYADSLAEAHGAAAVWTWPGGDD